jgi:hypothetical protein
LAAAVEYAATVCGVESGDLVRTGAEGEAVLCEREDIYGVSGGVAIRAIHQAVDCPGSLTIVAAPTERQSAESIRKAAGFLRKLDIRPRGDGDNKISLLLPNGSRIVGLPGDADTTRGFSNVSLLLIDEASRVPDEFYESLRPMLAANADASLWLMSTPNGRQGFFYDVWSQGGPSWTRIEAPATQCPRISPAFLEEERQSTTNDSFRQEYLCEFIRADFAYFDPELVAAAFRRGEERRNAK